MGKIFFFFFFKHCSTYMYIKYTSTATNILRHCQFEAGKLSIFPPMQLTSLPV